MHYTELNKTLRPACPLFRGKTKIDLLDFETQGFGNTKSGTGEHPNQGSKGVRAQGPCQSRGAAHQFLDLLWAEAVRMRPSVSRAEEVAGWDLGPRLQGALMAGERPHHLQATGPIQAVASPWQSRPPDGHFLGERATVATAIAEAGEGFQHSAFDQQLEP